MNAMMEGSGGRQGGRRVEAEDRGVEQGGAGWERAGRGRQPSGIEVRCGHETSTAACR